MEITLEQMALQLLGLPASSRALLAEKLIESLDEIEESEVEHLWVKEAEKRLQAVIVGKSTTRPAETVIREARENLNEGAGRRMKKQKSFDAVEMKNRIQKKIADEFRSIPEAEARKIQMQRVEKNPLIGEVLRKVRKHTSAATNK